MQVLMVTPCYYPVKGGTETTVRNLTIRLNKNGIQTDVMTFNVDQNRKPKWQGKMEKIDEIKVFRIPALNWLWKLHSYRITAGVNLIPGRFTHILKNYDIIHAHATGNKLVEFNKKCKAPTIYTAHSLVIRELKEWGYSTNDAMKHSSAKVQDKMMKFSDIITTPSEYIKDLIYEHYPDYSDKVIVIPNGTDFFKYKRDKKVAMKANQIRRKYSPNGEKLIGFVGRITADKGAVDLAKAFKSLLDLGYNVKLFYIGPIYRDSKMAIDQVLKGNEYKYMYVGSIDDEMNLAAWYKALDMVVLPTYHESFSLVGLECLAMGTPFVVSYIDGPKEILVDNRLAIGILPKDISSIL